MAAELDTRSIATFVSVSESTVNHVLDSPTADLVKTLLQGIEKKAKEFEQFKSQNVKLEVELETVSRTNESKIKVLQNSRDKALADVSKLRDDLQAAEGVRAQAQSELERIQQSIEAEAEETASLRNKVKSLEASHRDTLSLLDSKSQNVDRLAQDLTAEHDKVVALRRQVSELEQSKQEASSAATSAKFKQASLEQELELQRRNIEWYETERKQKAEEYQKFRREKNARVSELQQSLEQRIEECDSLRRSENALRAQLEDQVQRNEQLHMQIQKLSEDKSVDAEHHRLEIDGLTRLVELHKASADAAKSRVEELNAALEQTKNVASEEIGRIRAEVAEEHNDRLAAEQRVHELEGRIRDLESDLHQAHSQPGTPRNGPNGRMPSTPGPPATPLKSFTPGSTHRFKNGLSNTQLYHEYTKLEKEYASEQAANKELQETVDQMLADLEATKPEIEELRADNDRLQSEIVEMSQTADQANEESAAARKEVKVLQGHLIQKTREVEEAQQMARDLGSQVRRLLLEQQAGSVSDVEYERLDNDLREINQRDMEHLSEPQQQVNQFLLAFRNIVELQEVNERQVGTIRNLLSQVESAQAQETQRKYEQLEKDLDAANAKISEYREEIKHMVAQTKSFVKERDMFRSMLTRRGQIDPTDFSRSMPLPAGAFGTSLGGDRASPAVEADLARILRELQEQYDNYRREASTDTASLKNQLNDLSQRYSQLQAEASKTLGQLSAATQRYDMLQSNYTTMKNDNAELQKRYNSAMENATKQELRTQQAAEELVEAKGMVDGLRRESANLKAEKDLFKSVEKRLLEDNESLRNERARLDQLTASLQSLINEKEHSDSENRRRLQSQIDTLEAELQTARRKLEEEAEDKNLTALRRNYEQEQSQKRVDDLVASLGATREELAAVKTTKDHLQARVEELTVELRSAEERLEVFARPSATPARHINGAGAGASDLSREQELAVEVSELKRDLDLKSSELSKVEEYVEEYKAIAQAAEERLQQLLETNDENQADIEASLNEKDQKIKDLQQRVEDISAELSTTNSELSKLRDEQAESGRRLDEQKAGLQAEIDRLKAAEEKASEQAKLYLEASKEQQRIAEERQQNYEAELVKHTEAVKVVQSVRAEANEARLQLVQFKSEAENVKADLQQKESSWAEIEARYKQELQELKNRRDDVEQHNKNLHASLETLNTQLASLQRTRVAPTEDGDLVSDPNQTQDLSSLNEVIKYLKREKEIVEVRHNMAALELERVKRQLESTQSQLESTRLRLDQEQRAAMSNDMTTLSNNKLAETINELNLYRESAATLRAEKSQAQQALTEKTQRVEQLEQEVIPLRGRIAELEHHLELKQGEMDLLQKDRDGWQQRTQNILSKYDRVDPAELEELKSRVIELETERGQAIEARDALQSQIDEFPEAIEAARTELRSKLSEQFKARDRKYKEERGQLQNELNAVKEQLEVANARADAQAEKPLEQAPAADDETQHTQDESLQKVAELETRIQELEAAITEKDEQLAAVPATQQEIKAKEDQLKAMLNKRLSEVKRESEAAKLAALDDLRSTLTAQHEEEMAKLRSQSVSVPGEVQNASDTTAPAVSTVGDEEPRMTFEEFVRAITREQALMIVKESESVHQIVTRSVRKNVDQETQKIREELAKAQPNASSDDINQQIKELEEKFANEKEAIIRQKDEELNAEREIIIKQQEEAFEVEKQAWLEEQQKRTLEEVSKAKASTEKMMGMKMNMVQKTSASNLAKINVVKKAAEETPERPVKDVWEVAKVAKPPVEPAKPAPPVSPAAANTGAQAAATPAETPRPAPKAEPSTQTNKIESSAPDTDTQQSEVPAQPVQQAAAPTAPQSQPARPSGLPQPASRGNFAGRGQRGGTRGTGIPRPGSSVGNHGGPTSTRGRGGARGGHNNPSSPSRGGALNPTAQQFTPQTKRPREDGEDAGNQGKRIRGGGAGS